MQAWLAAGPVAPLVVVGFFLVGLIATRLCAGVAAPLAAEQERLEGDLRDALAGYILVVYRVCGCGASDIVGVSVCLCAVCVRMPRRWHWPAVRGASWSACRVRCGGPYAIDSG